VKATSELNQEIRKQRQMLLTNGKLGLIGKANIKE
jgi:hypothetical protein